MRKATFIIICGFVSITLRAQTAGVIWGTPINVGTGITQNDIYPRLTLTNSDIPLVVWEDNSPAKIYSSRKMGASFSTPIIVHNSGTVPFVANWAGAEVGSSGDTVFVVFTSMPVMSGKAYSVRSVDGGLTFSDTIRIDHEVGRLPSFPFVEVMPGGNPVVSYMIADTVTMLNTEYTVARSVDGGDSFLPSVTPVNAGNACECCPATIAVSGNNSALLFRNEISNIRDIWASFSTDASVSFPVSSEIDTTNWLVSVCPSSAPSGLITGDSLIYSWMSDATGDARIYIGTVNINDQQKGLHRQLYPIGTATQNFPVIAGKGDTLGIAWLGYSGSNQDVLFSWSVTGASGLGIKIDTITKGTTGHQSRPDLVFKNGKFHLVYSNSVGTQVQYLEGTIVPNVSVEEMHSNAQLELISSNINGSINLSISSSKQLSGEISIFNSVGQCIRKISADIKVGRNEYSAELQLSSGIYFIVVSTDDGNVYQNKLMVIK